MAIVNQVGNSLTGASGTGSFAGTTSPVFVTPTLGVATATSLATANLSFDVSANIIQSTNANGNICIQSNGTGRYMFGQSSGAVPSFAPTNTLANVGVPGASAGFFQSYTYVNSNVTGSISFYKSRSTAIGSFVAVQANDFLGRVLFGGDTGSTFSTRAAVDCQVTSVGSFIGSNLTFSTSNSASAINLIALTLGSDQSASFAGLIIPTSTIGIQGTTTNNDAAAGSVGECISSLIPSGSAISLTTSAQATVTSISLTAGDWDVSCSAGFLANAATLVQSLGLCSAASVASFSDVPYATQFTYGTTGIAIGTVRNCILPTATARYSLASTTTVYLVVLCDFSVNTLSAYGYIQARRVR